MFIEEWLLFICAILWFDRDALEKQIDRHIFLISLSLEKTTIRSLIYSLFISVRQLFHIDSCWSNSLPIDDLSHREQIAETNWFCWTFRSRISFDLFVELLDEKIDLLFAKSSAYFVLIADRFFFWVSMRRFSSSRKEKEFRHSRLLIIFIVLIFKMIKDLWDFFSLLGEENLQEKLVDRTNTK